MHCWTFMRNSPLLSDIMTECSKNVSHIPTANIQLVAIICHNKDPLLISTLLFHPMSNRVRVMPKAFIQDKLRQKHMLNHRKAMDMPPLYNTLSNMTAELQQLYQHLQAKPPRAKITTNIPLNKSRNNLHSRRGLLVFKLCNLQAIPRMPHSNIQFLNSQLIDSLP